MAIASGKRPIRQLLLIATNGDICLKEYTKGTRQFLSPLTCTRKFVTDPTFNLTYVPFHIRREVVKHVKFFYGLKYLSG